MTNIETAGKKMLIKRTQTSHEILISDSTPGSETARNQFKMSKQTKAPHSLLTPDNTPTSDSARTTTDNKRRQLKRRASHSDSISDKERRQIKTKNELLNQANEVIESVKFVNNAQGIKKRACKINLNST